MKLSITNDLNKLLIDKSESYLKCFTEYGMNYSNIQTYTLTESFKNSNITYNNLLLIPMTHINNIWHLMHHIFITYKFLKKNNINCDTIYPIFFKGFYDRQGDITKCIYNDLVFKGLGFDFNRFKNNYEIFNKNQYININNIYHVNESINFDNEPLFNDFKKTILNNFNIEYKNNNTKQITFILRNGSREITNINYVEDKLKSYSINYIYLENHTIKEQIEIIANTDILVGVHGAGLSWCIFMKNGSKLIEMYPGDSNTDNYIRWCKIANINYKRLCINITTGNVNDFRNATVNINDDQIQDIKRNVVKADINYFNIKHVWKNHPVNIGHFLHDVFFHAIVKYIDNNSTKWILDNDLSDWEYNITMCVIEHLHINFEINNTGIDTQFIKTNRNIQNHKYFKQVMKIIRTSVFNKYNIQENLNITSYKVLYFRNDASRRKMLNYNNDLNHMFDEIVVNMGSKTFKEQVKLFNKATHFVTIEGAHITNIIFMNLNTKILIFSPIINSWQQMFGTSKIVNNFKIIPTGGDFNSNIEYNDDIKNNIINFLD